MSSAFNVAVITDELTQDFGRALEIATQVAAGIDDLQKAATHASPEKLAPLREDFRFLEDAALLQRQWIRAYFSMRRYMDDPKEE